MPRFEHVLVAGASGFVGRALLPVLVAAGHRVRAATRNPSKAPKLEGVEWVRCDVEKRSDLDRALEGIDATFFLVHGMGKGGAQGDYAEREKAGATTFAEACAAAAVKQIVYLGGVAPKKDPSQHLASRLRVGEILRGGTVPAIELRAAMIIGPGSESWRIVRDLALRLPAMLLPKWTESRTRPIAVADVVVALRSALEIEHPESAWYDIPGPDTVSAREILERIAALRGRRIPSIQVPLVSPSLSSWWLKLITGADFTLARELVLGLENDLLPEDERYWDLVDYRPQYSFDAAASRALEEEETEISLRGLGGAIEEAAVHAFSPKLEP